MTALTSCTTCTVAKGRRRATARSTRQHGCDAAVRAARALLKHAKNMCLANSTETRFRVNRLTHEQLPARQIDDEGCL